LIFPHSSLSVLLLLILANQYQFFTLVIAPSSLFSFRMAPSSLFMFTFKIAPSSIFTFGIGPFSFVPFLTDLPHSPLQSFFKFSICLFLILSNSFPAMLLYTLLYSSLLILYLLWCSFNLFPPQCIVAFSSYLPFNIAYLILQFQYWSCLILHIHSLAIYCSTSFFIFSIPPYSFFTLQNFTFPILHVQYIATNSFFHFHIALPLSSTSILFFLILLLLNIAPSSFFSFRVAPFPSFPFRIDLFSFL